MPETAGSSPSEPADHRVEISRDEVRHLADLARIELDDAELDHLVVELRARLPEGPVVERDRWTLWRAVRGA